MVFNTLGLAAGLAIATQDGVPSDQTLAVALPGAVMPNLALGVAVSEMLARQLTPAPAPPGKGTAGNPAGLPAGAPASAPAVVAAPAAGAAPAAVAAPAAGVAPAAGAAPAAAGTPTAAAPSNGGAVAVGDPLPQPWSLPAVGVVQQTTYKVGDALHADPGSWQGLPAGATPHFQWFRDEEDIDGAHGPEYTLTRADFGHALSVQISYGDVETGEVSTTSARVHIPAARSAS